MVPHVIKNNEQSTYNVNNKWRVHSDIRSRDSVCKCVFL